MLIQKMEENFDPSNVDGAVRLAHSALRLARLAQLALHLDDGEIRLHMGRDQRSDLMCAILDVGRDLGIVSSSPNAKEVEIFSKNLLGFVE